MNAEKKIIVFDNLNISNVYYYLNPMPIDKSIFTILQADEGIVVFSKIIFSNFEISMLNYTY